MNEEIQRLMNILEQFQKELIVKQIEGHELSPVKLRDKVSQISEKVESIITLRCSHYGTKIK